MANAAHAASDLSGNRRYAQALRAKLLHLLDALRGDRVTLAGRAAPIANRFFEVFLHEVLVPPDLLRDHGAAQAKLGQQADLLKLVGGGASAFALELVAHLAGDFLAVLPERFPGILRPGSVNGGVPGRFEQWIPLCDQRNEQPERLTLPVGKRLERVFNQPFGVNTAIHLVAFDSQRPVIAMEALNLDLFQSVQVNVIGCQAGRVVFQPANTAARLLAALRNLAAQGVLRCASGDLQPPAIPQVHHPGLALIDCPKANERPLNGVLNVVGMHAQVVYAAADVLLKALTEDADPGVKLLAAGLGGWLEDRGRVIYCGHGFEGSFLKPKSRPGLIHQSGSSFRDSAGGASIRDG